MEPNFDELEAAGLDGTLRDGNGPYEAVLHGCGEVIFTTAPEGTDGYYKQLLEHAVDCHTTPPELKADAVLDLLILRAKETLG